MAFITTRHLVTCATVLAAALGIGAAGNAQAASYYNIVNPETGRALEATLSNDVKLAPRDPSNLFQQWKRVNSVTVGPFFEAAIENRLLGCLRSDSAGVTELAALRLGVCEGASSDSRKRWSHLSGSPTVPGFELVNSQTAQYVSEQFCPFGFCDPVPMGTLLSASLVAALPAELGWIVTWRYRFVTSAP